MLWIHFLVILFGLVACDDFDDNPIQYHSQSEKGSYKFGYDTGASGAHQFHQESKDESGVVRGKYGYTDPEGKLRLVYYSSGSNGYQAWGPDIPQPVSPPASVQAVKEPLKAPYEAIDSSKVSSRFSYPQSPAARIAALKSSKIVAVPTTPSTKSVQREEYNTKTLYSPADAVRARYSSSVSSKTAPIRQVEVKGGSPIVVTQQVKSGAIKGGNRPVPITPAQYKANYPPAGKYSRCYCE